MKLRSALATVVASTLVAGLSVAAHAAPVKPDAAGSSPLSLFGPKHVTARSYKGRVDLYLNVQLQAHDQNFELWSHRDGYSKPIKTTWHHGATVTDLPDGTMDNFSGLSRFLDISIQDNKGRTVLHRHPTVCLNGYTYRAEPTGAAHSPYPYDCPYNIFTLGSVQGIPAGWATDIPAFGYRPIKLQPGHYTVRISIASMYREMFGIAASDARRVLKLEVKKSRHGGGVPGPGPIPVRGVGAHSASHQPRHPSGQPLAEAPPSGPRPDLSALPAWGIGISHDGNHLQFSATVWNAGESPLVVDGFREKGKAIMDAYQYFYDADGNQTGYVPAGHMEWDPRPTHRHWHFEDFARYQLLDANHTKVQRSKKEAFCLANTDAIDYTVPGANWKPDNTDLATDCGYRNSLAVSEVLASGSGDTYEQFRAGQSFTLTGLKNGVYYVSVEANPANVLTEASAGNNLALRKVRIGGKPGHRTVHVYPVGDVTG